MIRRRCAKMRRWAPSSMLLLAMLLLVAGAVVAAAPATKPGRPAPRRPPAVAATVQETIPVRHVRPSLLVQALTPALPQQSRSAPPTAAAPQRLPFGLTRLSPDDTAMTLAAEGSAAAIAALRRAVATYDLPARPLTVQMRLVRVWFIGDGNYQEDIVARPIVSTLSGQTGQIRVEGPDGYSAAVTPFWRTDGTVLLTAELRVWDNGTLLAPARWQQTVKAGQSARLTGVTDAKSARVQELARKGQAPRQWAPATFNIYYLDVTPVAAATTDAAKPVAATLP